MKNIIESLEALLNDGHNLDKREILAWVREDVKKLKSIKQTNPVGSCMFCKDTEHVDDMRSYQDKLVCDDCWDDRLTITS